MAFSDTPRPADPAISSARRLPRRLLQTVHLSRRAVSTSPQFGLPGMPIKLAFCPPQYVSVLPCTPATTPPPTAQCALWITTTSPHAVHNTTPAKDPALYIHPAVPRRRASSTLCVLLLISPTARESNLRARIRRDSNPCALPYGRTARRRFSAAFAPHAPAQSGAAPILPTSSAVVSALPRPFHTWPEGLVVVGGDRGGGRGVRATGVDDRRAAVRGASVRRGRVRHARARWRRTAEVVAKGADASVLARRTLRGYTPAPYPPRVPTSLIPTKWLYAARFGDAACLPLELRAALRVCTGWLSRAATPPHVLRGRGLVAPTLRIHLPRRAKLRSQYCKLPRISIPRLIPASSSRKGASAVLRAGVSFFLVVLSPGWAAGAARRYRGVMCVDEAWSLCFVLSQARRFAHALSQAPYFMVCVACRVCRVSALGQPTGMDAFHATPDLCGGPRSEVAGRTIFSDSQASVRNGTVSREARRRVRSCDRFGRTTC
ncbi:hypothetical protein C8J57DRAFT_1536088 [Mycena rebaudengoi]|nr:hypothetical protein C8J57DRAFT_1536088 [Mycena rebaudengoi]